MAFFAASYDLIKRKDYPELWAAFKEISAHKCLRSVYLCDVECGAAELLAYLRQFIDDDDQMIVVPFDEKPSAHRCIRGTNAWIDARF